MDRLLPTTSGPTPDVPFVRHAPGLDALEELRAAWDAVTAAREQLEQAIARDGDPYETWRKAMGDEMVAHVAFVELAKDVANRAYGRVAVVPDAEPVIFPRRPRR
jgi:hypothetical protein